MSSSQQFLVERVIPKTTGSRSRSVSQLDIGVDTVAVAATAGAAAIGTPSADLFVSRILTSAGFRWGI